VILKNIVASMKPCGKIDVMDQIMSAPNSNSYTREKASTIADIEVMGRSNGKLRDLENWKQLFDAADKKLVLTEVVAPPGSHFSIIELMLVERLSFFS
jgi:hypothetical protein